MKNYQLIHQLGVRASSFAKCLDTTIPASEGTLGANETSPPMALLLKRSRWDVDLSK